MVNLRDKCKKSKSKKIHAKYEQSRKRCMDRFDFLVEKKTRKYRGFSNYEDLKQDGRIALMLALNSYELGKGDFFWWADKYIKTKVSREANRHSTIKIPIKHTKRLTPYKVSQLPIIIDGSPDASDTMYTRQVRNRVRSAVTNLPEDQRKVVLSYFEFGGSRVKSSSINKICKDLKISRVTCLKLLNDAKEVLRHELGNLDS
jgi:RNA polymerase sigma factor (sigma-70 family)